jgi:hypothetical protein
MTNGINYLLQSLVTDDDQEQLCSNPQKEQPVITSASFQYLMTTLASIVNENQKMLKVPSYTQSIFHKNLKENGTT